MKSLIVILLCGIAFATADQMLFQENRGIGTDFVMDNLINPMINGIKNNTVNYLLNNLIQGILGKRDLQSQIVGAIGNVATLFEDAKNELSVVIASFAKQIQALVGNIFNPVYDFSHLLEETDQEIRRILSVLVSKLHTLVQSFMIAQQQKSMFLNITTIMNQFATTISQTLENYGRSLVDAVANASVVSASLLNNLGEHILATVHLTVAHLNQAIAQLTSQ